MLELDSTPQAGAADSEPLDQPPVTSQPQPGWRRHSELIAIVAITLLAAVIRLWHLGSLPPGLHGDEGWTGIDADRVLRDGWIGVYVKSALGQPAGPEYWAAIVLKLLGDGVFQVRFAMTALGIATVPLTYLAARLMFERRVALLAALILSVLEWHVIYSRVAFMVISWPMMEMAVVALLFLALRRGHVWLYAVAGIALGLGVYTYNVYPLFAIVIGVFLVLQLLLRRREWRELAPRFGLMLACALIAAIPLLLYVANGKNDYWAHSRVNSLTANAQWKQASAGGKAHLLVTKTWNYAKLVAWGDQPDASDGAGRKPVLDWLTLGLTLGGIALCLQRIRDPASQLLVIVLLTLPFGAILSINNGSRRTVGLAPFVAIFVALALAAIWRAAERTEGRRRRLLFAFVPAAVLLIAAFDLGAYFQDFGPKDAFAQYVYVTSDTAASEYMAAAPGHPYVYFLAGRWSINYETKRYLAPDVQGEDRSVEFSGQRNYAFDRSRDSLVILLPPYFELQPALQSLYPDAQVYTKTEYGQVLFIALRLPKR